MKFATRLLTLALAALMCVGLFAACGGDDTTTTTTTSSTTTSATTTKVTTTKATTTKKQGPIELPKPAGTASNPYKIGTAEELSQWTSSDSAMNFGNCPHIKLTANIDMTGKTWHNIQNFSGSIDGDGYVISNLTVKAGGDFWAWSKRGGLFNTIVDDATIKNVAFVNMSVTIENTDFAGGIFGEVAPQKTLTIENVLIEATINASESTNRTGILGGYLNGSLKVTNFAFYGSIASKDGAYHYAASTSVVVNNCYSVMDKEFSGQWTPGDAYANSSKIYALGALTNQIAYNIEGTSFAEKAADGFTTATAGTVVFSDMYGDNMKLGDAWTTFTDFAPIQKVFAANHTLIRSALSDSID